jgi:membrane protease YdiL (CAAX protease family)
MPRVDVLRLMLPLLLAGLTAAAILRASERRGLRAPALGLDGSSDWAIRRALVALTLTLALYFGVFSSLGAIGLDLAPDLESLTVWSLFWIHLIMLAALGVWFLLGFAGAPSVRAPDLPRIAWRQFGLDGAAWPRELALGVLTGALGWAVVMGILLLLTAMALALGWGGLLPEQPPALVLWIVSLPWMVRLMVAVSAGVVEELFFRGFLQPRIGILASTALFGLAHLGYGEPFLLVGIVLLSLGFAYLTVWRGNIWAAVMAHFLFDAIQLLFFVPFATGGFVGTEAQGLPAGPPLSPPPALLSEVIAVGGGW